jgi:hypothetical protein
MLTGTATPKNLQIMITTSIPNGSRIYSQLIHKRNLKRHYKILKKDSLKNPRKT